MIAHGFSFKAPSDKTIRNTKDDIININY